MDNTPTSLVLGGLSIIQHAGAGPIRQRYEPIGGSTSLRLNGGTGIKMTNWSKTSTTASGSGNLDPGLFALDVSQPLELLCVAPRAMIGTARQFALPPAAQRRPDVAPWGWAYSGGRWLDTNVDMNGDSAELQAVVGASAYRVFWLPRLVVFTPGLSYEFDEASGLYDWSLSAEEI
ncbi:hypothetical protein [Pseudomonas citronellolis]|uniref:hypothetical protein n=1 Tax=Pseudomonas citronellolis TaxID=53408 RepID=UPI00209E6B0B|nr:hypothetical protein [Pseudomonas citronellolis]MCP1606464.1 hypothetical protein [Pseudomonas citronellolis]MCP1657170.1 hypothetical protein [Pseudomonas citronellolis]MCP1724097.1 hypothetical protein [Pseudomonas citronellolis]